MSGTSVRRTAQFIEGQEAAAAPEPRRKGKPRGKPFEQGNSFGVESRFKPGESGNPGGLPGTDLAAAYARWFFEAHPEGIGPELCRDLKGFNAHGYGILADRAYGKIKEHQRVEHAGDGPITHTILFGDGTREAK